jgi:hypothetical protein
VKKTSGGSSASNAGAPVGGEEDSEESEEFWVQWLADKWLEDKFLVQGLKSADLVGEDYKKKAYPLSELLSRPLMRCSLYARNSLVQRGFLSAQ